MVTKYHRRKKKKSVWVGDERERRKREEKKKEKKKKKKSSQSCRLKSSSCFCRLARRAGKRNQTSDSFILQQSEPNTLVTLVLARVT